MSTVTFLFLITFAAIGGASIGGGFDAARRAALRSPLAAPEESDSGPAEKFIVAGLTTVSIVGLVVVLTGVYVVLSAFKEQVL